MKPFLVFAFLIASVLPAFHLHADDAANARKVPLSAGDEAPDFTLKASDGSDVMLSSFRGKSSVVLYFYPKDGTPGCTKEAQDFRDDSDRFKKAGAVILGVSVDDVTSHRQFTNRESLNFLLLADVGGAVSRQYGVMGWIMAKRVTYVISKTGKIKTVFGEVDVTGHSKAVLKIVQELAGPGAPKPKAKAKTGPAKG